VLKAHPSKSQGRPPNGTGSKPIVQKRPGGYPLAREGGVSQPSDRTPASRGMKMNLGRSVRSGWAVLVFSTPLVPESRRGSLQPVATASGSPVGGSDGRA
jgi:hypothetical protein